MSTDNGGVLDLPGRIVRPPSSYGSMKTDSDIMEVEVGEKEERLTAVEPCPVMSPQLTHENPASAVQENRHRPASPETFVTMETELTRPAEGVVIDTRVEAEEKEEADEEEDGFLTNSPEPPEPPEHEQIQTEENGHTGQLHQEQNLAHIFRSIQGLLSKLSRQELLEFKRSFSWQGSEMNQQQLMLDDLLDFVDKMLEVFGPGNSLVRTISCLETIQMEEEAAELRSSCSRALIRFNLQQHLSRTFKVLYEGVPRAGRQNLLDKVYVSPLISPIGAPHSALPQQEVKSVNDLFQLHGADGRPVRTVMTSGIPGVGLSVAVAKFCLDWAEQRANQDLQFVVTLSFRDLWYLRSKKSASHLMSLVEVMEYYHPECRDMRYLDEEDCRLLVVMDSFDCYQAALDWEAPVIMDSCCPAQLDHLIVNIIRGNVLRGALVWILGRRAAISQIPSELIDVATELQGFRRVRVWNSFAFLWLTTDLRLLLSSCSEQGRDDFLTKRFSNQQFALQVVAHHKRQPLLAAMARQPFVCWMVAIELERCLPLPGYSLLPPRLTPFYVSLLIVQTNRRLERYGGVENTWAPQSWCVDVQQQLLKMGQMAFKMLERRSREFTEADLLGFGLDLREVTVYSGLCTERLPSTTASRGRSFCFQDDTFQEFMAALYVFAMFHCHSRNVLDLGSSSKLRMFPLLRSQSRSVATLLQCALTLTQSASPGHYNLLLRFLCGLLSPDCHHDQLSGFLFPRRASRLAGLQEARRLLENAVATSDTRDREQQENLQECLQEMVLKDL